MQGHFLSIHTRVMRLFSRNFVSLSVYGGVYGFIQLNTIAVKHVLWETLCIRYCQFHVVHCEDSAVALKPLSLGESFPELQQEPYNI